MKKVLIVILSTLSILGQGQDIRRGGSSSGGGGNFTNGVTANPALTANFIPRADSSGTNLVNSSLSQSGTTNINNIGNISANGLNITNFINLSGVTAGSYLRIDSNGYITNSVRITPVGTTNISIIGTLIADSVSLTNGLFANTGTFTNGIFMPGLTAGAFLKMDDTTGMITNVVRLTTLGTTNLSLTGGFTADNVKATNGFNGNLITITSGTASLTANTPNTIIQTINNAGVTFNTLTINQTNTASAAASSILDLQVSGTSRFKVGTTGATTISPNGTTIATANTLGLGVGITPVVKAQISDDGTTVNTSLYATTDSLLLSRTSAASVTRIIVSDNATAASAPSIMLERTRGTLTTPTVASSGDAVGLIFGRTYDGSSVGTIGQIKFEMDATPGVGDIPGRIVFLTTPDGAASVVEAMRIDNAQRVGVGVTPTAMLHLKAGTATASTAPLKFSTGTLLTTAEAGAMEFLTDAYYVTTTTGAKRRMLVAGTTGRATGQTAANASVSTYTLGATDASYEISANVLVTTSSAETFTVTCDYTDEGNTARTITFNFSNIGGTIGTGIAFANGAVPYEGIPLHIRCKASTAITIKTAAGGTYTGCTYNVEGIIKQES